MCLFAQQCFRLYPIFSIAISAAVTIDVVILNNLTAMGLFI